MGKGPALLKQGSKAEIANKATANILDEFARVLRGPEENKNVKKSQLLSIEMPVEHQNA